MIYYMTASRSVIKTFGGLIIASDGHFDINDNTIRNVKDPVNDKDATNKEYVDRFTHIGDIKMSVHNTDFYGWLKCDGRSLSRTTYADLFAIIGTSFGSADSNSFNLPDCRGRVLGTLGQGSGLTNRNLGSTIGTETHTLTTSEIPSHSHSGTTDSSGAHTHTSNAIGGQGNLGLVAADGSNTATSTDSSAGELNVWTTPAALTINSSGDHTHNFTSGNAGGGSAHNIMQPTIFIGNVFIYSGLE